MKRKDVFERLEPPPGGLSGLRRRLSSAPSRRPARAWSLVVAFAIAAALVFLFGSRRRAPDLVAAARRSGGLDEVALGLAPSLGDRVVAPESPAVALARVPTANANVTFYWAGSGAGAN